MFDDNKGTNQNGNGNPGNGGSDAGDGKNLNNSNTNQGNSNGNSDDGKNKENFVPQSRFNEVNEEVVKLRKEKEERERKDKEAQDNKLKEEKKFEELATKHEEEAKSERAKANELSIQLAVERASYKAGIVDTDAAYKLIDRSKISVDANGVVVGVDDAITALLTAKPYLKGNGTTASTIGAGTNPGGEGGKKTYPMTWVRKMYADMSWQREKHADMGFGDITGLEILTKIENDKLIDYNS